ncbi:MAG: prepilin-type N-terminal cleavage/methylation domain-containing protein [Patescibacteria group bacterium]|jgi:prepilin-type N-terminal cleavage/methylation domain-containing protein
MKKNKSGFTLIELLVVIAIIGLLSTISILALNSARARARDAKRVADVKQIQTALEMYYNDVSTYPATATTSQPLVNPTTASTTYMALIPPPPTPTNDGSCTTPAPSYTYTQTESGLSYTINYCLGAAAGGIPAGPHTATPAGIQNP